MSMHRITDEQVKNLIESFNVQYIKEKYYEIQDINPIHFLTWSRFDLAAKLLYLEDLKNNREVNDDIYAEHIRLLTLGKFKEPGNKNKNSLAKYKQVFKTMYLDFKKNGFDDNISLLPSCKDGSIANGGHRVACAIDLGQSVKAIEIDLQPQILDYRFFQDRGASVDFLDRCATTFIKYSPNTYVAIVWPAAIGHNKEIERILGNIVYYKELSLSIHGLHNLVTEIYQEEPWLGNRKKNYPGAAGKTIPCFIKDQPTRIYAFQSDTHEEVLIKKQQIRNLFKIGKHSIHINDFQRQTIYIANFVFNLNSEHFLNYGSPNKYSQTVDKFDFFIEFCQKNNINIENIVLDGGIVLALYGLRKCNDIDYIYDNNLTISQKIVDYPNINSHNGEMEYHAESIGILVHNSSFHFRYRGMKILSLQQIIKMKERRNEPKDQIDLSLIKTISSQNSLGLLHIKVRSKAFFIKAKLFYCIVDILIFFHFYNFFRYFYRKLKGNTENKYTVDI